MSASSAKQPVILLYGGRSTEHEISCRSAAFVVANLSREDYELTVIAIDKSGNFVPQPTESLLSKTPEVLPIVQESAQREEAMLPWLDPRIAPSKKGPRPVIFPMLHGSNGEDGLIQGLFELCQLPYVGCDVKASALAMDKILTKEVAKSHDIPIVPYVWFRETEWQTNRKLWLRRINESFSFPLFVKPASLGSSVGVSRVTDNDELAAAVDLVFNLDEKVLIESGLKVREIEFAALGDYAPRISCGGESIATKGFYDYKSKYQDKDASRVEIPAKISARELKEARELARKTYQALDLYGLSRIDLFLCSDGRFYLNEVNTMPGFTSISQYPALWRHEGIQESDLLSQLIKLAQSRFEVRSKINRSYD